METQNGPSDQIRITTTYPIKKWTKINQLMTLSCLSLILIVRIHEMARAGFSKMAMRLVTASNNSLPLPSLLAALKSASMYSLFFSTSGAI